MNFRARLIKAFPVFSEMLNRSSNSGYLTSALLVDGAVAGDLAVAGIKQGDKIVQVLDQTNLVDLTSEFSIKSDGVINNTGGTSTAAAKVNVIWEKWA